jgi:hypothetical protein
MKQTIINTLENKFEPKYELPITPRQHQIKVEDARNLRLIDLFKDEVNGDKHLSRADLILIYTLYPNGLEEFLDDYLDYVEREVEEKGYKVINKPHYFLKNIIG